MIFTTSSRQYLKVVPLEIKVLYMTKFKFSCWYFFTCHCSKFWSKNKEKTVPTFSIYTQPAQRRRKGVLKTSYFWSQRYLRLVSNGSCEDLFLKHRQDVFQETSLRRLPEDVLKTSSRRRPKDVFQETSTRPLPGDVPKTSKTSSRLFLVKAKDNLDTIYGFSIYVRFKLLAYYHCIIR